ncbi:hypothetical protein [Nocardia puris]|uniref:Uncharacterized protein n=1 Tax=Nocardia puris TaxID=208602 RepID=A0A366DQ42_9NOCA|nr:hypothetical protein [Nocardia puris]RBO91328.1 hypothetical protein DFR74_10430 [Nocardia puris]
MTDDLKGPDLPFGNDDHAVLIEAADVLGLSLPRTIAHAAAAYARQLISAHRYR